MATVSHTPPPTEPRAAAPGPLQTAGQFTLGVLLLAAIGLLGWLVFGSLAGDFKSADATRADERRKILADRQTEDYKYLHDQPSWFAKDKKLVRVPIEEAMRMTLPELRANKPHAAYPIDTPPPDNGAPTSPDKGAGSTPGVNTNPTASNPTVGHPEPTPVPNPTPSQPASAKSQTESTPAPTAATPTPAAAVPAPVPMPTATPAPSASAAPTAAPANNDSNPGSAPIPGKEAQPMPTPVPQPTVDPAAQPSPASAAPAPAASASPANAPGATPTPGPNEPGASPAGTL